MLTVVRDGCPGHERGKDAAPSLIDEIACEGARRMLAEALRAEVDAYISRFADQRGEDGRRVVVRDGYHQSRAVLTSAGAVEVTAPRVNGKRTDLVTGGGGRKELIALAGGYRESAESWADLLRDCARRGMRAPALAAGDGASGLWNWLREVLPEAREGRCWFRKTANVLAALPKPAHPGAKKALAGIWGADDNDHARAAVNAFEAAYGLKFPKAVAQITDDLGELPAFCGYPAEHWVHLRTSNPIVISSPAADVRDVAGEQVSAAHLRSGRGYLWPVQHAASGGVGVRSAGGRERLAA